MATTLVPLFPGMPGGIEIFVVLLIVVLLFGANKLPKLARSSGQAMGEFKKGREEIEQELADMKGDGSAQGETTADATTATETTTGSATETTAGSTTEMTTDETAETEAEKQN